MNQLKKSRYGRSNDRKNFSYADRLIMKKLLRHLTDQERYAIYLRYWMPMAIIDVARRLKKTWDKTYEVLLTAHRKLKEICLSNAGFFKWEKLSTYARL